MGLWYILTETVASNTGVATISTLTLLIALGSIILMGKHFQIGVIVSFMISTIAFIVTYTYGENFAPFATLMFIYLVILSLSIYASSRASQEGTLI